MRGIAALLVAAFHIGYRVGGPWFSGFLAVDLFFALSGFVIALNYDARLRNGLSPFQFTKIRILRLFPLYTLGLALGLAKQGIGLATGHANAIPPLTLGCDVAFAVVMLPSVCSTILFPLNDPSWSLFFEFAINIIFAFGLWRASSLSLIVLVMASAVLLCISTSAVGQLNVGWTWGNFDAGLLRAVFSFCIGMIVFRYCPFSGRRRSWLALLIIGLVVYLIVNGFTSHDVVLQLGTIFIAFPILLVAGIFVEMPDRLVKAAGFVGDLSYPIYAIHFPLIALLLPVLSRFRLPPLVAISMFLALLVCFGYVAAIADVRVRAGISYRLKLRRAAGSI